MLPSPSSPPGATLSWRKLFLKKELQPTPSRLGGKEAPSLPFLRSSLLLLTTTPPAFVLLTCFSRALAFHRRQISTVVGRPKEGKKRVTLEMLGGSRRECRQAARQQPVATTSCVRVLTRQRKASLTACVCMWKSHRRKKKWRE